MISQLQNVGIQAFCGELQKSSMLSEEMVWKMWIYFSKYFRPLGSKSALEKSTSYRTLTGEINKWSKKTLQECEVALTSQYQILFLVFVFCLLSFVYLSFLSFSLFVLFAFLSGHHADQMSEGSEVSKVTLCVEILKWR